MSEERQPPIPAESKDAPRRKPLAPGVADERFAANVRAGREAHGMSQADLAREMAERGWRYYPQTVHRIEAGTRKVSVGEAEALARILNTTMERLTWPDPVENLVGWFDMFVGRADRAFEQIISWTYELLFARNHVEKGIESAERRGFQQHEQVGRAVRDARALLDRGTPEAAVETGREEYESEEHPGFELEPPRALLPRRGEVPDGES